MARAALHLDRDVPALIVKFGNYPFHHGGVGAIRSLGRLGIPVYAITEDSFTPAAVSRYLSGRFVWPTTGCEEPAELRDGLSRIGRRIGRRAVAIPTDEEAAVLLAEHAAVLGEYFLLPAVEPGLPRRLASKRSLHEMCVAQGVPAPASAFPGTAAEVAEFARQACFPIVAKNLEAFMRRRAPAVGGTTLIRGPTELLAAARGWGDRPSVILQEYLPREHAEDWIVHIYSDSTAECLVTFTGLKIRSWPPHAGMTACAYAVPNPVLADLATGFCKRIGFRGAGDMDWRYDRRDGRYKLVDFNPRIGAQFRLFQTTAGMDIVRALHLDLTGRPVPAGIPVDGRRLIVENIDIPARLAYRNSGYRTPRQPPRPTATEFGWLARDDLRPFLVMTVRILRPGIADLLRLARFAWRRRRFAEPAAPSTSSTPGARSTAPGRHPPRWSGGSVWRRTEKP